MVSKIKYQIILCFVSRLFQGTIYLYDLTKGELVRKVKIDDSDKAAFVNHLQLVGNMGVACVLGTDIKVVHFPTILEKAE